MTSTSVDELREHISKTMGWWGMGGRDCYPERTDKVIELIRAAADDARFEAMAYVLLSTREHAFTITRVALRENVKDWQIITQPDSRLSGVEYRLEELEATQPNHIHVPGCGARGCLYE